MFVHHMNYNCLSFSEVNKYDILFIITTFMKWTRIRIKNLTQYCLCSSNTFY